MKNRSEIKTILGLTQNEMGMLFGIPKSTWTMFKSGQRDISLTAKEQLANLMESSAKRKKSCKEIEVILKKEIENEKITLKEELITTELKIKRVSKGIENLNRTRENLFAAYETAELLANDNLNPNAKSLADSIRTRVINSLKKYNLATLTALQLKKETLEMLKLQLQKKLKS
ncbi:MAG: hypothetical protein V4666_04150 [Bacteroidota bacterium]